MRRRNSVSVMAIFLLILFCLWLRKFKIFILIICAIALVAVFILKKDNKNETEEIMKIDYHNVYEFLTKIPKGKVVTYGMIAEYLGNKHFARTVGNILRENPDKDKYPCYKVVSSKGELSENYAFGGIQKQKELLIKENIEVKGNKVDLDIYKWNI